MYIFLNADVYKPDASVFLFSNIVKIVILARRNPVRFTSLVIMEKKNGLIREGV